MFSDSRKNYRVVYVEQGTAHAQTEETHRRLFISREACWRKPAWDEQMKQNSNLRSVKARLAGSSPVGGPFCVPGSTKH
jgi:hypothetical protein